MKVLVVDSGGRGHAIAWQFKNDPNVTEVICTPGNAGIAREIRCENVRTNEEILEFTKKEKIDLVFIGPESPLTKGIVDLFTAYLLEANVRLGDPEAEVILPRLKTPLSDISFQIINGVLSEKKVEWTQDYFCDIVAAAGRTRQIRDGKNKGWYPGYPGRYGKGYPITGIENIQDNNCKIFFAGVNNSEKKVL
jgi:phosphoribosylamine-glycine ligase